MDSTAWLVSGLLPAAIAAISCLIASFLVGGRGGDDDPRSNRWHHATICLGLGWVVAVVAALYGQRIVAAEESSFWWSDEFWHRGFWGVLAAGLLLGTTTRASVRDSPLRWVIAGLIAIVTAAISLPVGDGWDDALPLHRGWAALLASGCLAGFFALDRLANSKADRWFPLVVLAALAGPMFVAATTYGAIAQWTLSALAATAVSAGFALAGRLPSAIAVAIGYPAIALATVINAAGRFYSFEEHPWWSYALLIAVAPTVAGVDWAFRIRSAWLRAFVAAVVSIALIAVSVAVQLSSDAP